MNPINININVDNNLIKKFIIDIYHEIYNKNNEPMKHNTELLTIKTNTIIL